MQFGKLLKFPFIGIFWQFIKNGRIIAILQIAISKNSQIIAILQITKIPLYKECLQFIKTAKLLQFCKLQFIKTAKLLQ
jgi:hypothetical protein